MGNKGISSLRIGVIGAGVLGSHHIAKCLKNPEVTLTGFYDSDVRRRHAVKEQLSVHAHDDMASLLSGCDAVIIATPGSTHREIGLACLAAGKHLLVEKPLAASYAEGADLVRRAQEAGVVLHVGHSEAFNAAFGKLLSLRPDPRFIEIHRLAAYSPRGTDVSVILDLMVHDLQLIVRLCGEEPLFDKIAATGVPVISDGIDIASVRLAFPSGCVANLTASRISAKRMRKIRVFAKDNYFSVDLDKGEIDHYFLSSENSAGGGPAVSFQKETALPRDALESELMAFVDAVKGGSAEHAVAGKEALPILKISDVILKMIAEGKRS
jgi:predicted dehydrogenase